MDPVYETTRTQELWVLSAWRAKRFVSCLGEISILDVVIFVGNSDFNSEFSSLIGI